MKLIITLNRVWDSCKLYTKGQSSENMKKKEKSGNDLFLTAMSFGIAILGICMHIYSIELVSEFKIGDSLVVEKIANGMYVLAILLMIYVAGDRKPNSPRF